MTPDLDELERLAKAATPGPWEVYSEPDVGMPSTLMALRPSGDRVIKFFRDPLEPLSREDLDFAAAANPATMLALIARIRELEAREASIEGALTKASLIDSERISDALHVIRSLEGTPNV